MAKGGVNKGNNVRWGASRGLCAKKPSFLAHAQNTPIDAATNPVQNQTSC